MQPNDLRPQYEELSRRMHEITGEAAVAMSSSYIEASLDGTHVEHPLYTSDMDALHQAPDIGEQKADLEENYHLRDAIDQRIQSGYLSAEGIKEARALQAELALHASGIEGPMDVALAQHAKNFKTGVDEAALQKINNKFEDVEAFWRPQQTRQAHQAVEAAYDKQDTNSEHQEDEKTDTVVESASNPEAEAESGGELESIPESNHETLNENIDDPFTTERVYPPIIDIGKQQIDGRGVGRSTAENQRVYRLNPNNTLVANPPTSPEADTDETSSDHTGVDEANTDETEAVETSPDETAEQLSVEQKALKIGSEWTDDLGYLHKVVAINSKDGTASVTRSIKTNMTRTVLGRGKRLPFGIKRQPDVRREFVYKGSLENLTFDLNRQSEEQPTKGVEYDLSGLSKKSLELARKSKSERENVATPEARTDKLPPVVLPSKEVNTDEEKQEEAKKKKYARIKKLGKRIIAAAQESQRPREKEEKPKKVESEENGASASDKKELAAASSARVTTPSGRRPASMKGTILAPNGTTIRYRY